ncbi:AAA family ATPase [Scytonema sp. NUACC21]
MVELPGIQVLVQIYESAKSLVYRGIVEENNQPVILKLLKKDYPTPAELVRYHQEYEITRNLDLEGVVKSYKLQKYQNTLVMLLEDFGGESLDRLLAKRQLTLTEFLKLAIQITDILVKIHQANIIHKDINPSNIVFNAETGQLKIIDFGLSSILLRENTELKNPYVLEGTLAYISPEQTGRINRTVDYRSDFYSLGTTFYEMLTNRLPFETNVDVMELVYCHIAKQPIPVNIINPQVPLVVSEIVMKLMAKTAEERYQSAYGIKADLEVCLNQLQHQGKISNFELCSQDISDKFQISQKLYGREEQIKTLLKAFEKVSLGQKEFMLVSGYSGIGKSALVQEIYKPITEHKGYFISGKFDQLHRNIPYGAVVHAFTQLVRQLLVETEEQLQEWRDKLLVSLGSNAQVIVDVIPEIELIIGKQPALAELAPVEAQNRFNLVFQNFIGVFCQKEHPLVIFLDDLQWADLATLKLIQLMMTDIDNKYLFLIGSYRDNEVNTTHPLTLTLSEIKTSGASINTILLLPLDFNYVNQLIADTLKMSCDRTKALAELVLEKTQGNPFFMNEFLKSLYTQGLLVFDFQTRRWQWDLQHIRARDITDNVVELMAKKIQNLPEKTQEVLRLAACIGNYFDLKTLSIVHKKKLSKETAEHLWSAIQDGLVVPLSSDYKCLQTGCNLDNLSITYKFVHDRVQQAAYFLITDNQKQAIHLQIGQLLLKNTPLKQQEESIFDIVDQLNLGCKLIDNQEQRDELAKLNLIAGKKAKASAAFQPAFTYLIHGLELLAADKWQKQYKMTLDLYVEAAEAAYLSGQFAEMEKLASVVLQSADQLLDKVKVYEVQIAAAIAQGKLVQAIDIGISVLNLFGLRLPRKATQVDVLFSILETKFVLLGKRVEDLIHLPQMTVTEKKSAISLLCKIFSASYLAATNLLPIVIFKTVTLLVKYGNVEISAYVYASYGTILCGTLGEIELGNRFGDLALSFLELFNSRKLKTSVVFLVYSFIKHWRQHGRHSLQPLKESYINGIETGDFEYAAYCAHLYSNYCCFLGEELAVVEREMYHYINAIKKIQQQRSADNISIHRQMVLNLLGQSQNPCYLIGESYNELENISLAIEARDYSKVFNIFSYKLVLSYLFGEYEQAINNAMMAEEHLKGGLGTLAIPAVYFYDTLARLAVYPSWQTTQQKSWHQRIKANYKKLKEWAAYAPMNHLHRLYLIEAEWQRVLGQECKAMKSYEKAIALARKNEYLNEEALGHELAAKFYLAQGNEKIARVYMENARYCYLCWGAMAKVQDLDSRYPQLLTRKFSERRSHGCKVKFSTPLSISERNTSSSLDLATIIKASQTLSEEIVLEKLLTKLMLTVIENAGAQKGVLILETQGKWFVQAVGELDNTPVVLQSIPLEHCEIIPLSIINYVTRIKGSVVLNDVTHEGKFTSDSYIKNYQPQSVLCAPLIHQGKLTSIVYLENNLTTGAFTSKQLEIVKLLCFQAAIALENALLYAEKEKYAYTLEQKVAERTEQLEKANQELQRLVSIDGLTQVANRRHFNESLSQEWKRLLSEKQPLSLILCDVDYFKPYNDFYGHQRGDECLRQVAKTMADAIKRPADLVARYGGEEFAVILPNTDIEGALKLAEEIRIEIQNLKMPHAQSDISHYVTLSLGVTCVVPVPELSPEDLIATADEALYAAKKQGRDCSVAKDLTKYVSKPVKKTN